jgi:dienelactone hydrolase
MSGLETVRYRDGDTALTGWLARPAGAPRAAILVFPTIANPNPPIERRARMLAEAGYLALIADFYGEPGAISPMRASWRRSCAPIRWSIAPGCSRRWPPSSRSLPACRSPPSAIAWAGRRRWSSRAPART